MQDEELLEDEIEDLGDNLEEEPFEQSGEEQLNNGEQQKQRFGEKEYNNAKDKDGVYDKNHYKAQKENLNKNIEDAKAEKAKSTKEKKGKVKKDPNTGKAVKDPKTGKKIRENPITKKKNAYDKAKDSYNIAKAKNAKFQNKVSNAKAKTFKAMHPIEAAKAQVKNKAKRAVKNTTKKAAKQVGKAAVKGTKLAIKTTAKIIQAMITYWPITLVVAFIGLLIFTICIFAGALGDDVSMGNTPGVAGASVKYTINGVEINDVSVKIMNSANTETLATIPFEKYVMGLTIAQLGKENLTSNPEAFKAALIINRNSLLSMEAKDTLGFDINSKTVTVNTLDSNYIYWDYTSPAYKLEKDGQTIYSPEVNEDTAGAVIWKSPALNNTEISNLESIASDVLGVYLTDVNNSSNIYKTSMTEDIKTKIINLSQSGKDYTNILIETYGAANINIEKGEVTFAYFGASGEFTTWKQYAKEWGSFVLGDESDENMKEIGCLVTSYAIAAASLNAEATIANFNPGTFAKALKEKGAFGSSGGLNNPSKIPEIIPGFTTVNDYSVRGKTKAEKIAYIRTKAEAGYAIVMQVKRGVTGDTHFVVLDAASSANTGWNKLMMWNPSRAQNGDVFTTYGNVLPEIRLVSINK